VQALKRASVRVAGCVEFWVLISSLAFQLASEPSRFAPSQRSWVDKIRVQQSFFAEGKFCRKFGIVGFIPELVAQIALHSKICLMFDHSSHWL